MLAYVHPERSYTVKNIVSFFAGVIITLMIMYQTQTIQCRWEYSDINNVTPTETIDYEKEAIQKQETLQALEKEMGHPTSTPFDF
jgi:hypothetical protein